MMSPTGVLEASRFASCDEEPIHNPGYIQPHGFLLAVDALDLRIVQASSNVPRSAAQDRSETLGLSLRTAFPELVPPVLEALADHVEYEPGHYIKTIMLHTRAGLRLYDLALHRSDMLVILELEEATEVLPAHASLDQLYRRLNAFVEALHAADSFEELCALLTENIRQITGFDRTLIYRFDRDQHGTVVAEQGNGSLPSYLDLRFPASDIPPQARELYRRNRLRIIPDADYEPIPIEPVLTPKTGRRLDLSHSVLRSVSPVHLEYMRNMGTQGSMSVSILVDGVLWGLVSCHSKYSHRVPLQDRSACDLFTRIFALQLASKERASEAEQRLRLSAVGARLLSRMAEEGRFLDALRKNPEDVLAITNADGAAIVGRDICHLLGRTPAEPQVRDLCDWLAVHHGDEDLYATDVLAEKYRPAHAFTGQASGMLAIQISKKYPSYLIWFRPEVVQTVRWAGKPEKVHTDEAVDMAERLHPRRSFEIWKDSVEGHSLPWSSAESDAARNLHAALLGIVLKRAEELAALSEELQRSNKELEAFSYSVSHDLRAPFRHIVGYSQLLRTREGSRLSEKGRHYVDTIVEAAFSAGTLVDNLLNFSQMGRNALNCITGDMKPLVDEMCRKARRDVSPGRIVEWQIGSLGRVYADPVMLRLVLENLLSNAVKYTRGRPKATIKVGREPDRDGEAVFFVSDNGVGFDMAYVDKLFGVFQRLHRAEEFEGTGIGLANVRRIVERHGGRTWALGQLDEGATFYFTLPIPNEGKHDG